MTNGFDDPSDFETSDDECPCCRMMAEEWGVVDEAPLQRLLDSGVVIPHADAMTDAELRSKLQEICESLAEFRIFLEHTDHLSDRELYGLLCSDVLLTPMLFSPGDTCSAAHVSLTDHGTPGDDVWLRYYADEDERRQWLRRWPEYVMPPHVDPPYRRDALLPRPYDAAEVPS